MTLDDSVHGLRLHAIQRAAARGNVTAVCRELGISRTLFYRWRKRYERYGVDGVHPRRQRARPGRPSAVLPEVERLVLSVAISAATWGCARIAGHLTRTWQVQIAPSTVQRLLRRVGLATRRARLTVLEQQAARAAGLLTERTQKQLWRARHGRTRHVQASEPGELVCLDTFYVGKLKGVGKVWQITACDVASSYGAAAVLASHTAADAAAFLRDTLVPLYAQAGWPLRRVLTDGGPEFKGAFDEACRQLGIRHTRTKPRHAWTNGFVERLQGTILQEHWRVAFRRRYFTSRVAPQHSLDAFLRYYNRDRPHQGYRVRGRTRPPSSSARSVPNCMSHSGTVEVSTPFRVWTR
jgi:transposase InsO family protein